MNYRIFVEKKMGFNLESIRLKDEIIESFNLNELKDLRIVNIYDIFGIDKKNYEESKKMIFSEMPTDEVYESLEACLDSNIVDSENIKCIAYEYLPGQFDQRADSAMQCLKLLSNENENVIVRTGKLIILVGKIKAEIFEKIKKHLINPVECREKDLSKLEIEKSNTVRKVKIFEGFNGFEVEELEKFIENENLAMTIEDLKFIQKYFKDTEKREPTETEIKVLDTYWSDHCRHTTFETKLEGIIFPLDKFGEILQKTFNEYIRMREDARDKRKVSLMDMATVSAKYLKSIGKLDDLEKSDEINACSVFIDVDVDGKIEKYLLMFKNETHNHPTEIEPFGGAATCLGGAIRDPLSGRAYVYQAIRVTGSANPLEKLEDTLENKLPQKKITLGASDGYSSYGNQIGIATSHVAEIYNEGYKAKRMEVGAVVGAVPSSWVRRENPVPGDKIILLGGKTGRDGIGGATGSSKKHTDESIYTSGAEVQKGNAPEERKIQRFFRNEEVIKLIKKCNDFGAGGVSVAIGELAPGLEIDLDKVPVKYDGLNGTELAISESQERMAVALDNKDVDKFIKLAAEENLSAVEVAKVTELKRLVITWKGEKIVDIDREFLDTNGVLEYQNVEIETVSDDIPFEKKRFKNIEEMMWDLNVTSQKGLMEKFDSTIGGGTVLMPFGGKYQMTPTDVSVAKIPVLNGKTNTASAITWGYNPEISSWSQFHGGIYAIIESLAKIVAIGGDYKRVRLSFQEYFQKLGKNPKNWGKPFSALLGTIYAQKRFEIPAIGGKDSMSGSFNNINVPPTLISFAVGVVDARDVISPEFKKSKNKIYLIKNRVLDNFIPNIDELKDNFEFIYKNIKEKNIVSAMSLKVGGIGEALSKMCFGNRLGAKVNLKESELFGLDYGDIIVESVVEFDYKNAILLGEVIDEFTLKLKNKKIDLEKIQKIWLGKLAEVFPYKLEEEKKTYDFKPYEKKDIIICKNKVAKPRVLIPVFPGTNCEYDSARAFENAGGISNIQVFRNRSLEDIESSIENLVKGLDNSQILMLSGGFSAGDEPDGSGKFIANILTNEKVSEAIEKFIKRDGLILGICNGFQALIKSGLLPYGKVGKVNENSPTLTFNKIGRHVSQMVKTKVVSNKSPWFSGIEVGEEFMIPISHGEGRFVASDEMVEKLVKNGMIATQYVNFDGVPTNEYIFNPNGSTYAIEGITSLDGHILGKMGHSERYTENTFKNISGNKKQNIFENGVKFFKE